MKAHDLKRWQKILLVMYELSDGSTKRLNYEDIVVVLFKKFPETFHLRGYPQYPESGDLVHKPLYSTLKPKGLVKSGQKMFALTGLGIEAAKTIKEWFDGTEVKEDKKKLNKPPKHIKSEVERILSSDVFNLFRSGEKKKILDTDLYSYLGVSVYTDRSKFLGRLKTIDTAVEESENYYPAETHKMLKRLHKFMLKKFEGNIKELSGND